MQTGWVRVMTPGGGSSNDVESNHGFVSIPEVGGQVLLGFRHGDPTKPHVMGSLFNRVTGGGGGQDNNYKSLTTRSDSPLGLDDPAGSVTLHDKGGVKINFDSGGSQSPSAAPKTTASVGRGGLSALTMDSSGNVDPSDKTWVMLTVGGSIIAIKRDGVRISSKSIILKAENSSTTGTNSTITGANNKTNGETDIEGPKLSLKGDPVKINQHFVLIYEKNILARGT